MKGSDIADEAGVCHSRHRMIDKVGNAADPEKVIIVGGEVRSCKSTDHPPAVVHGKPEWSVGCLDCNLFRHSAPPDDHHRLVSSRKKDVT